MRRLRLSAAFAWLLCSLACAGCGDRAELPNRAFVMGVGIDDAGNGQVLVTFQIYKPSQKIEAKGKTGLPYINVHTKDTSVMEAIRDITIHLGRKAQFSHMRIILISERIARKIPVPQLLDMFYRDNEPRLTTMVGVTEGKAADYFDKKPFIENTISQQYYLSEKSEQYFSGKTIGTSLLSLALQLRSESGVGTIPYLSAGPKGIGEEPSVAGLTIIRSGVVAARLDGKETEGLLMLLGRYKNGITEIPCTAAGTQDDAADTNGDGDDSGGDNSEGDGSDGENSDLAGDQASQPSVMRDESVEMIDFRSSRRLLLSADGVKVRYRVHAVIATLELTCTKLDTAAEERAYTDKISAAIKRRMQQSMVLLQRNQSDLLGIGNDIYKHHPQLWKKWKPDWPAKFAALDVDFDVDTVVLTHGTTAGKSLLKSSERK